MVPTGATLLRPTTSDGPRPRILHRTKYSVFLAQHPLPKLRNDITSSRGNTIPIRGSHREKPIKSVCDDFVTWSKPMNSSRPPNLVEYTIRTDSAGEI